MAATPQSMAEKHRDEIAAIIAACETSIVPHKSLAFYRPGDSKEKPPAGWSRKTASDALRHVNKARAKCSADIRAACERHIVEANAKPQKVDAAPVVAATEPEAPEPAR